ncbi:MAG: nuclease-related domain-containing protein [Desulfomicrobium apsheronum]|nr:nuclease-related domain-containing protein [Desulfomicrobium apsheronum]
MIIKSRDPKDRDIAELDALLKQTDAPGKRFLIERELRAMKAGIAGEEDCAYYINFYFGKSDNWCVIHDLRIEHQGSVAQIDHLLVNRLFEIYVIESKNFSYEVAINDSGEFTLKSGSHSFGIPSPIEQNKRHIFLLEKFIADRGLTPSRLGIPITPRYRSLILMSPKSVISRPDRKTFDTDMVIKADTLRTKIDHIVDKINPLQGLAIMGNMSTIKTVTDFAESLRSCHSSTSIDYRKRFGIKAATDPIQTVIDWSNGTEGPGEKKYYCFKCRKAIPDNVARFCWNNKERFGGKAFCYECQKGM